MGRIHLFRVHNERIVDLSNCHLSPRQYHFPEIENILTRNVRIYLRQKNYCTSSTPTRPCSDLFLGFPHQRTTPNNCLPANDTSTKEPNSIPSCRSLANWENSCAKESLLTEDELSSLCLEAWMERNANEKQNKNSNLFVEPRTLSYWLLLEHKP